MSKLQKQREMRFAKSGRPKCFSILASLPQPKLLAGCHSCVLACLLAQSETQLFHSVTLCSVLSAKHSIAAMLSRRKRARWAVTHNSTLAVALARGIRVQCQAFSYVANSRRVLLRQCPYRPRPHAWRWYCAAVRLPLLRPRHRRLNPSFDSC